MNNTLITTPGNQIQPYLEKGAFPHVTRSEYLSIMAETDNAETRLMIEILWITGSRVSEVLALCAGDLVRRGSDYNLNITRSKRRKPVKELLAIPADLGIKIEDYARLRGIRQDTRLFPVHRATAWRRIRTLGKKALGRDREIHPHMFRHGRVYDLAQQGEHPFVIAKIVGHVCLQTTMGYFHPSEHDIRDALRK